MTQIVAAVIRRDGEIVLVRQQGPEDPEPVWALPGGRVEGGELLTEALSREVREETGLRILTPIRLAAIAQLHNPTDRLRSPGELPGPGGTAIVYLFEAGAAGDAMMTDDPDGLVSEARWMPRRDAIRALGAHPWPFMRDPAVAYLERRAPAGATWLYRRGPDGEDELVDVVPASLRHLDAAGEQALATSGRTGVVVLGCLAVLLLLALLLIIGLITVFQAGH